MTLPSEGEEFTIYGDTSRQSIGCVLMQVGKIIVYISRQMEPYEQNHPTCDLELAVVVFMLKR